MTDDLNFAADYARGGKAIRDALAGRETARPAASPFSPTATGRAIDLLSPDPDTVSLRDIAAGLAKQCRWNGASGAFYSVAQHSVMVADLLPMAAGQGMPDGVLKIYGLLHDAHEIATGDIAAPMKRAIADRGAAGILTAIERGLDRAIHAAFGLPDPPAEWKALIKRADMTALATERRDLMPPAAPIWSGGDLPPPVPTRIKPLAWDRAEELFIDRARTLANTAWLSGGAWER